MYVCVFIVCVYVFVDDRLGSGPDTWMMADGLLPPQFSPVLGDKLVFFFLVFVYWVFCFLFVAFLVSCLPLVSLEISPLVFSFRRFVCPVLMVRFERFTTTN